VLKRAKARQAGEKLTLGAAYADSGSVACTEAGQPLASAWPSHLAITASGTPRRKTR